MLFVKFAAKENGIFPACGDGKVLSFSYARVLTGKIFELSLGHFRVSQPIRTGDGYTLPEFVSASSPFLPMAPSGIRFKGGDRVFAVPQGEGAVVGMGNDFIGLAQVGGVQEFGFEYLVRTEAEKLLGLVAFRQEFQPRPLPPSLPWFRFGKNPQGVFGLLHFQCSSGFLELSQIFPVSLHQQISLKGLDELERHGEFAEGWMLAAQLVACYGKKFET